MLHTRFTAEPPEFVIGSGENSISNYQKLSFFRVSSRIHNLDKSEFFSFLSSEDFPRSIALDRHAGYDGGHEDTRILSPSFINCMRLYCRSA